MHVSDTAAVTSASKMVASRYRGYVDFEDLQQECYVWLLENQRKVSAWREEYSEKYAENMLLKALRRAAERYARKEKAQVEGYSTDDEFFYSLPVIAKLLRLYFDPERFAVPGQQLSHTPSGAPANEGGNLMAMVADVGRAYEGLPDHDKNLMYGVYGSGEPSDNIEALALEWSVTYSAAKNRVHRCLGRVRQALGGPSPYVKDDYYDADK